MWDGSYDMGWWMVLWMTLAGAAWVGLLTLLISSLTEGFGRNRKEPVAGQPHETALEAARRRYASGELSEEEFGRVRENLR